MIEKVANNKFNTEKLNLNPPEKVKEKLDYFRTLFNKTHDLPLVQLEELTQNIKTFFNLKSVGFTDNPPSILVRISNNNNILTSQGKELSYLTDISQLLAPPIKYCNYGRCNIKGQQVLYCATSEAGAYWETKPKNGDVITLSHYELKPNAKVKCNLIRREKRENTKDNYPLIEIAGLLEEFLIDVFSLEVSRDRPVDYLFSSLLSSEQLFYPVVSYKNIEAIIYPSVQKKKNGENFAIRNDLILERYNLVGVETRFILDEYENLDPTSDEVTTDQLIGSFGTTAFDFETGKILYNEEADEIFKLFRKLQTGKGKQVRYEHPNFPKNIPFNLTPTNYQNKPKSTIKPLKLERNDKVNVVYQDGTRLDNVKYKKVSNDIIRGKCKIMKY
ncbi:MAG: RES domain-containing protein [Bacteroidetes bacterium]|nr:RES domain-containing protein [Bacteroidota bacterium]